MPKLILQSSPFINYNTNKYLLGVFLFLLALLIRKANHVDLWFFLLTSALATFFIYERRTDILLITLIKQCSVFLLFFDNLNIAIFLSAFLVIFDAKIKNYFVPEPFFFIILVLSFFYEVNINAWGLEETALLLLLACYMAYFKDMRIVNLLIFNISYLVISYFFYGLNSFGLLISLFSLRFFRFPLETFVLAVLIAFNAEYFAVFIVLARVFLSLKTYISLKKKVLMPVTKVGDFKKIAFIKCRRDNDVIKTADYNSIKTCFTMNSLDKGPYACKFACLGLGDCIKVCPQKTIFKNGDIVKIDAKKCTGCGVCLKACPRNILVLVDKKTEVFIHCNHQYSLKKVSDLCVKACLGCGKCRKACSYGAIKKSTQKGAFEIDIDVCLKYYDECLEVCQTVCPRQILSKEN